MTEEILSERQATKMALERAEKAIGEFQLKRVRDVTQGLDTMRVCAEPLQVC